MKKIIGISLALFAVTLFSCQNDKIVPEDELVLSEKAAQITLSEVSLESALTETEYEIDFYSNALEQLAKQNRTGNLWRWSNRLRYRVEQCPNVEIESEDGDFPKTITLDYGNGTELQNGKVLSGIIIVEISAPRKSEEYKREVKYIDFGVDTLTINGTSEVSVDRNDETFRTFETKITVEFDSGSSVERESERTWQWIEGMDTEADQTDDVMQITGYAEAQTSEGDEYLKEIVEPLIRIRDCRFIVQGIVEITLNDELISTLDYGDGTCDAVATVTKDGESTEIDLAELRMKRRGKNS